VWLTAAIGMACGAGLPRLAVAGTAGYLFVVLTYTPLVQRLPRAQSALAHLRLDSVDGRGVLREALMVCSAHGFTVGDLAVVRGETSTSRADATSAADRSDATATRPGTVQVTMTVQGGGEVPTLVSALTDVDGIVAVSAGDLDDD
jgi:putative Mg2+ transporter-C (MgtC) family protein